MRSEVRAVSIPHLFALRFHALMIVRKNEIRHLPTPDSCHDVAMLLLPLRVRNRHHGLFDHLVGAGEQRRRNRQAKRFSSAQVNHQVKFRRLQDWQFDWLVAFENAPDIDAGLPMAISNVGTIGDQAPGILLLLGKI